ncbi:hypothetical protein [Xanthomonas vasicola]|uniref:hypothetical protein n=1 Tax=Xanthomonas vasicola TaxID=56459 RepID=UPI001602DB03|nr:hypothetical protein [Xanthomonas vasicola]
MLEEIGEQLAKVLCTAAQIATDAHMQRFIRRPQTQSFKGIRICQCIERDHQFSIVHISLVGWGRTATRHVAASLPCVGSAHLRNRC